MSDKKPTAAKTRDMKPFGLRLLPDLKKKVEERAAEAGRSLNAQIAIELENHPLLVLWWQGWVPEREALGQEISDLKDQIAEADRKLVQAQETLARELERWALLTHRRIPEGLFTRITRAASKNNRPVEEEIVQALEKAFPPPRPPAELRQIADMIEDYMRFTDDEVRRPLTSADEDLLKLAKQLRQDADEQEAESERPQA